MATMRRRNVVAEPAAVPPVPVGFVANIRKTLPKLDVYPKLDEEHRVRTQSGAALSLVMGAAILMLFFSETYHYMQLKHVDTLEVDTTLDQRMRININISFLALSCKKIDLIAMDVAGEHQLHVDHKMQKTRLTLQGEPIGKAFDAKLGGVAAGDEEEDGDNGLEPLPADYCGSCYGAGTDKQCCNTCASLKAAYRAKGWGEAAIAGEKSEQCLRDKQGGELEGDAAAEDNEGCLLEGYITVNKVAGNFHVALGTTKSVNGRLIHAFAPSDMDHYNTSHKINSIAFGEWFDDQNNPLSGQQRVVDKKMSSTGVYQYFIKLVPTLFTNARNQTLRSCQYSYTEKFIPVGEGDDGEHTEEPHFTRREAHKHASVIRALPGVFFVYDMSPFLVHRVVDPGSFSSYFARLCAVVGGVFTISGLVDSAMHHVSKQMKRGKSGSRPAGLAASVPMVPPRVAPRPTRVAD